MLNLPSATGAVARNFGGSWTHRRRIIYSTLAFCAFCILWLLFWGSDTELNETIANSAFFLAGGVIGSYVFGAVWDDKSVAPSTITKTENNQASTDAPVSGTADVDNPDNP
jgi:hypothetical protein